MTTPLPPKGPEQAEIGDKRPLTVVAVHGPGPNVLWYVGGVLRAPAYHGTTNSFEMNLWIVHHSHWYVFHSPEWHIVGIVALEVVPTEGTGALVLTVLVVLRKCSLPACRASETSLGSA